MCPHSFTKDKFFFVILIVFFTNIPIGCSILSMLLLLKKRNLFCVKRIKELTNYSSQMLIVVPILVYLESLHNNYRL